MSPKNRQLTAKINVELQLIRRRNSFVHTAWRSNQEYMDILRGIEKPKGETLHSYIGPLVAQLKNRMKYTPWPAWLDIHDIYFVQKTNLSRYFITGVVKVNIKRGNVKNMQRELEKMLRMKVNNTLEDLINKEKYRFTILDVGNENLIDPHEYPEEKVTGGFPTEVGTNPFRVIGNSAFGNRQNKPKNKPPFNRPKNPRDKPF